MARREVFDCEVCLVAGEQAVAEPHCLKVDDTEAILDLCPKHDGHLLAPPRVLLRDRGRPVGEGDRGPRPGLVAVPRPVPRLGLAEVVRPPVLEGPGSGGPVGLPLPTGRRAAGGWPCPGCLGDPAVSAFETPAALAVHSFERHAVAMADVYAAVGRCRVAGCGYYPPEGDDEGDGLALAGHCAEAHEVPTLASMICGLALTDPERVEDLVMMFFESRVVTV